MANYSISVYHDSRQDGKRNKVYPVKIRVYFNYKTRHYPLGMDITKKQFERS